MAKERHEEGGIPLCFRQTDVDNRENVRMRQCGLSLNFAAERADIYLCVVSREAEDLDADQTTLRIFTAEQNAHTTVGERRRIGQIVRSVLTL